MAPKLIDKDYEVLLGNWKDSSEDKITSSVSMYASTHKSWVTSGDAPVNLFHSLGKAAELRSEKALQKALQGSADVGISWGEKDELMRLWRLFVDDFSTERELVYCRDRISEIASLHDQTQLLMYFVSGIKNSFAVPLYSVAMRTRSKEVHVLRLIETPIPKEDYSSARSLTEYSKHIEWVMAVFGADATLFGSVGPQDVVRLEKSLWHRETVPQEEWRGSFPRDEFLSQLAKAAGCTSDQIILPDELHRRLDSLWSVGLTTIKAWLAWRMALEFIPFVSDDTLKKNSRFFAGRRFGIYSVRSRPSRFVSLAKTVLPHIVEKAYTAEQEELGIIENARKIALDVKASAAAWAASGMTGNAGIDVALSRMGSVTLELGQDPVGASAEILPMNISTVCAAVTWARGLSAINSFRGPHPARVRWQVHSFDAVPYYQSSRNAIVIPWAVLRQPVISTGLVSADMYAFFGTIFGHELAHAVLPGESDLEAASKVWGLSSIFAATSERLSPAMIKSVGMRHARELAADALGYQWARSAALRILHGAAVPQDFDRAWAARWRENIGSPFSSSASHPSNRVRCDVPPALINLKS
ncbi:hypothetical protein J7E83_03715 [Arthrobacter sp. ISL-48]|uniref:M13-type metalloendopeptidase n=1 Tax=Arthrobacter sp. ISL-48 TaxID=2819110 RepID=UPI001BEB4086|nr:M13-type metalloendopeptidase [Arthrobacter sp. ISL-48]MBT2531245.1 hypothetical protein [Arthrobacter sp. ISL-48]